MEGTKGCSSRIGRNRFSGSLIWHLVFLFFFLGGNPFFWVDDFFRGEGGKRSYIISVGPVKSDTNFGVGVKKQLRIISDLLKYHGLTHEM